MHDIAPISFSRRCIWRPGRVGADWTVIERTTGAVAFPVIFQTESEAWTFIVTELDAARRRERGE